MPSNPRHRLEKTVFGGTAVSPAVSWTLSVVVAALAVWLLGWMIWGDHYLPIRWGAFIGPWLGLLAVLCGIAAASIRNWWLAALASVLAFLILLPVLPRLSPARWFAADGASDVRVLTFNVSESNTDYAAMARVIVAARADIVFLQQINDLPALRRQIGDLPGHRNYAAFPATTMDTAILSRFALLAQHDYPARTTAVAAIGTCRVRLWDLHAPHGQYGEADQAAFFRDAAAAIHDEPLTVIAGGDLNSTEYNAVQAPLRNELEDAFSRSGSGFGLTFPAPVRRFGIFGRLFAIDHIFFRGDVTPVFAQVLGDSAKSDHFPVLATFNLKSHCS
ncbi:MAG TPA: endonuclease/exonuclease/phosphatase family protein [Rhizomicrobium sp.]|jgi:endonuclease/exonuclease/phosphatase (EEP) superfamily protein YafD|nr:endonuclease/exonuclease/phosphatase family protein [Rhizomicrobium sp.]